MSIRRTVSLTVLGVLLPLLAQAALVGAQVGTITSLWTYVDYGSGDVVVEVSSPLSTCQLGFWLRMSDVGARQTYAQLLSYQLTGTPIKVYGSDDQIWSGSAGRYCRIYTVGSG